MDSVFGYASVKSSYFPLKTHAEIMQTNLSKSYVNPGDNSTNIEVSGVGVSSQKGSSLKHYNHLDEVQDSQQLLSPFDGTVLQMCTCRGKP